MESVWDYPRPPRLEPTDRHIVIRHAGRIIADTRAALRVLETSHPPVYYLPPGDVERSLLEAAPGSSFCEWKGAARYWNLVIGDERLRKLAWSYPDPVPAFRALIDHLAFYAGPLDECLVDGERVEPQPGGFYGGWVTSDLIGPFKGGPGTGGW
ncbi:MAG: DUF427 domain-containing protein [marine benthic group bacterium]|nr:DUF427 domain-containing protein [Gemmatimonadota bacterium]MCL7980290.1 DUF427 domain-containing protein [Gemmatimonadota bacterium]